MAILERENLCVINGLYCVENVLYRNGLTKEESANLAINCERVQGLCLTYARYQ